MVVVLSSRLGYMDRKEIKDEEQTSPQRAKTLCGRLAIQYSDFIGGGREQKYTDLRMI